MDDTRIGSGESRLPGEPPLPREVTIAVRGEWLEALAVRVRLYRVEWRVLAIVLSSPRPVSASSVAKRLRLDYCLVKRVVRDLEAWGILERTPAGLRFEPDHTRWGLPGPQPAA